MPIRRLAVQHELSEASVRRHHANHLPQTLARAVAVAEDARANDLLDDVDNLRAQARAILDEARRGDKPDLALRAIARLEKLAELLARMKGLVDPSSPAVNVNVTSQLQVITDVQDFQRLLAQLALTQAGLPPARPLLEMGSTAPLEAD